MWLFLTIIITITTSKTFITNKILKGKKNDNSYLWLHPNYEETTLSNTECKHNVHYDQKVHMSLNYGTSIILFSLKIFPLQHGLLLWSPSHKSVTLEIMLVKTCLDTGFLWCSFRKLRCMVFFVTVLPLYCFSQTLHSIKYSSILELQVKFFFIWITSFESLLSKVIGFFMLLHNWQGGLFLPHG